jgi:glycosyltransferase involved in cell wall biosynthesis
MGKICIVTPDHLAVSSRSVKEADALQGAGHEVTVIFGRGCDSHAAAYDAHLMRNRVWRAVALPWERQGHRGRWLASGLRQKASRALWRRCPLLPLAARSLGRVTPELAGRAAAQKADLYIGHHPAGLAAAGWAARRTGAFLAFDAEDFHLGEGAPAPTQRAIAAIQERYLPGCAYVSSSSGAIGAELTAIYPTLRPVTLYNVSALDDFSSIPCNGSSRTSGAFSLYWVSRTIGLDRGLEDVIRAVGLLKQAVELHLRGACTAEVEGQLRSLAASVGVEASLHLHPPLPPWGLAADAARHDVGLALEQPVSLNHDLCASIKLFLYLSAGLAVAATATSGQREVLSQAPGAGILYPPGDHVALAAILRRWQEEPEALAEAKKASLEAARTRFHWELESRKLVRVVEEVLQEGKRGVMVGGREGTQRS